MSFVAVIFIILGAVILALLAVGLWNRRSARDIWDKDRLSVWGRRSRIEQEDVEEILEEHPEGFEPEREEREPDK